MAVVKKSKAVAPTERAESSPRERVKVRLPEHRSKPSGDLSDYTILVHGRQKIGKTTLFSGERLFYFEFDPYQGSYRLYQEHMPDWRTFLAYLTELEKRVAAGTFSYSGICVDRVDLMYKACMIWCVENRLGGVQPEDLGGWEKGQAWAMIRDTADRVVRRLFALPGGKRFICHSKTKEVQVGEDEKIEMLSPDLPGQADSLIAGRVDILATYQYNGRKRVLIVLGDERTAAGHRLEGHFQTPDGQRVREIPMGDSSDEAYRNLLRAFNNEQAYVDLDDRRKQKGGETSPRVKKMLKRL